jgi:glycosyltransferase involved in cell wall biosynthesis
MQPFFYKPKRIQQSGIHKPVNGFTQSTACFGNSRSNGMIKVSIIIPVYNVEKYLQDCLDSVINQTLKEIEIICINDGSQDGSLNILKQYAAQDNRIRIMDQSNKGLSATRNAGLRSAIGKYIYFLDSDDCIELNAMDILYAAAEKDELDIVYFDAKCFYENADLEENYANYKDYYERNAQYPGVYCGQELYSELVSNKDFKPSACLQFIRTDFLKQHKINFLEGIIHEDNLFSFLCIIQAEKVKHEKEILFKRRMRENSVMTSTEGLSNLKGYFICYCEILKYIKGHNYSEKINQAIKINTKALLNHASRIYELVSVEERNNIEWHNIYYEILYTHVVQTHYKLVSENRKLVSKNRKLVSEKQKLVSEKQKMASEKQKIRNSKTYKIGSIITFLPRKCLKILRICIIKVFKRK